MIAICSYGQQYDEVVFSDKKAPDEDNKIFKPGKTFVYNVRGEGDSKEFPDQMFYSVLALKKSQKTNKKQTEVVIHYKPDKGVYQSTGIVENKDNVWLHPPRNGKLKVLETCPFPFVKLPLNEGMTWNDQLLVGEQWSDGKWKGSKLFDLEYRVISFESPSNPKIMLDQWIIEATAKSDIGDTQAKFSFSEEIGFTAMEFVDFNGSKIIFELVDTYENAPAKSLEEFIMSVRRKD